MYNKSELEALGFSADEVSSFDPTGAIVDEQNAPARGKFTSAGVGKDAIFTLRLVNQHTTQQRVVELFNAINHITEVPNDSVYSNFGAFQPFTSSSIIAKLASVAVEPEATEGANVSIGAVAIFNDLSGDLVYIASKTLATWNGTPLNAANNIADAFVKCNQVPYKRLLKDLNDLVLAVRTTKMKMSSEDQVSNALTFQRVKTFGGAESNTLEPSEFLDPINPQTKNIVIPRQYYIDKQTAIYLTLEPEEDMTITFFVSMYRNNGVVIA